MEQSLKLPKGFRLMQNQVAGHTFTDQTPSLGMLLEENSNCVLKPLGKPECGKRELSFYESLKNTDEPILLKLKELVPKYHHKVNLFVNQLEHIFMKLEDLTHGMQNPCVMDIKIGRRTWDPIATPEKQSVEEQKYAKCKKPLGLCLPGFQMYCLTSSGSCKLHRYGKEYGKQLDENGFRTTIALFVNSQHVVCRPLVEEILRQLYKIRSWFNMQTIYHFYASSILLVYDAACLATQHSHTTEINGHQAIENGIPRTKSSFSNIQSSSVRVRMIDFAHVFPATDGDLDENYLFGLRNLIAILENLLCR